MKKKLYFCVCLIFLMNVSTVAFAAEYNWRFSIPWTRPLLQKSFEDFAKLTKNYTNGKINIKIFPNGLLGNHEETFKNVQYGDTEMAMLVPYISVVPGGALNFMPWTVSSYAEFSRAFDINDGILHKIMNKAYEESDMKVLFTITSGGYGLANNKRQIKKPIDLQDLKMRVSASKAAVTALGNMGVGTGMTMETIPWSELYNSLSRGVVDGCWNTIGLIVAERQYEVIKYFTNLGFMWDCAQVVINLDTWKDLPDDLKKGINRAAKESMNIALQRQIDAEKEDLKILKDNGLLPYNPTNAEKNAFEKASKMDSVWKEEVTPWLEKAYPNQNMTKIVKDELAKIRESEAGKK